MMKFYTAYGRPYFITFDVSPQSRETVFRFSLFTQTSLLWPPPIIAGAMIFSARRMYEFIVPRFTRNPFEISWREPQNITFI